MGVKYNHKAGRVQTFAFNPEEAEKKMGVKYNHKAGRVQTLPTWNLL